MDKLSHMRSGSPLETHRTVYLMGSMGEGMMRTHHWPQETGASRGNCCSWCHGMLKVIKKITSSPFLSHVPPGWPHPKSTQDCQPLWE